MVTITDAGLRHTMYETVYDLVNTAKSGYSTSSTPLLLGGYPDTDTITFPTIVLMPVVADESELTIDTDFKTTTKEVSVQFMLFATNNKDLDYLADGVSGTLRGSTFPGAFLTRITEDNGFITPAQDKVKLKTLTATYKRR